MHPYLLKVPNCLFYKNAIENGYKPDSKFRYFSKDKPLLFINCTNYETNYGTSYTNKQECKIAFKIINYLLERF